MHLYEDGHHVDSMCVGGVYPNSQGLCPMTLPDSQMMLFFSSIQIGWNFKLQLGFIHNYI